MCVRSHVLAREPVCARACAYACACACACASVCVCVCRVQLLCISDTTQSHNVVLCVTLHDAGVCTAQDVTPTISV